jgi:DNA/RNA endonuclease G (NUC1)
VVTEYKPYTLELLKLAFGEPNGFWNQWSGKNIYCHYIQDFNHIGKTPDWAKIVFTNKLLDEQFNIEKEAKFKADKELEQKRAISKF